MNCPQCQCYCPPDSRQCPCGHRFPEAPRVAARPGRLTALLAAAVPSGRRRWLRLGFLLCVLLAVLAWALAGSLPAPADILPPLYDEPLQTAGDLPAPFTVTVKKATYIVTPLFHYQLAGLVVSEHRSDSFLDVSHRRWRDFLNTKDVCVVWGRNIRSGVYREMKFWNRDFTCMYRFPDAETGRLFSVRHMANNHLLSDDPALRRRIRRVRPGDQVRFRGYLVAYSQPANGFHRSSSTVRHDTGNGACETVWINEFEVLRPANPFWRAIRPLALAAAGALLLAWLLV